MSGKSLRAELRNLIEAAESGCDQHYLSAALPLLLLVGQVTVLTATMAH